MEVEPGHEEVEPGWHVAMVAEYGWAEPGSNVALVDDWLETLAKEVDAELEGAA